MEGGQGLTDGKVDGKMKRNRDHRFFHTEENGMEDTPMLIKRMKEGEKWIDTHR